MDIEKQKKMMVYKAKEINEAVCRLSNDAYKFILLYISMIRPDDDPTQEKLIYLKDYCLITDENQYTIKDKIHGIIKEIAKNPLSFRRANGDFLVANWFPDAEWIEEEKKLVLSTSKKLWPFLFDLKKKLDAVYNDKPQSIEMQNNLSGVYLAYPYGRIANVKGNYTIKFYEILKPAQKVGELKIDLATLRVAVGAFKGDLEYKEDGTGALKREPKYIYSAYANFKQSVLKPAQKEMAEKMDITFTFEDLKRGKKVVSLKFKIKKNENYIAFAQQGLLFTDDDTCPPPDEIPVGQNDDRVIKEDDKPKEPVASSASEIPSELVSKISKEQWDTDIGCKKVCEEILEAEGLEAVNFYLDAALQSKPKVEKYGPWIRAAWKRGDRGTYLKNREAKIQAAAKKKEIDRATFVPMFMKCDAESLKKACKEGNEFALEAWNNGRGKEIEAEEKEMAGVAVKLKQIAVDPKKNKMFAAYMVSRKNELNKVDRQSLEKNAKKGVEIGLFTRQRFINDFLATIDDSTPYKYTAEDDAIYADDMKLLDAMDAVGKAEGELFTKEEMLEIIKQIQRQK